MMLTRILLLSLLRTAALLVGASTVLAYLIAGPDVAYAFLIGGLLVGGSGAVQIWLVGYLLDPNHGTPQKVMCGTFLMFKLVLVGGVLWWILTEIGPDETGLLMGMGVGLMSLVLGVNRGSMSQEGLAAMERAEDEIGERARRQEDAQKMEDSDP